MPMYETTVRTPEGEKKVRVYAPDVKEAKKLFENLYGGPRYVPYIPHVVPSQNKCGNSSVGRALACQARCRRFDPDCPLHYGDWL